MSHTYETNSPHIYLCLRIGLIALIDVQMDLFLQTNWYSVQQQTQLPYSHPCNSIRNKKSHIKYNSSASTNENKIKSKIEWSVNRKPLKRLLIASNMSRQTAVNPFRYCPKMITTACVSMKFLSEICLLQKLVGNLRFDFYTQRKPINQTKTQKKNHILICYSVKATKYKNPKIDVFVKSR